MAEAFFEAGIPRESISIYPGEGDVGAAVLDGCSRSLIFGGTATVDRYRGNPKVQAHGPGFSKILLGDDQVDQWEKYLDVMVDSVFAQQRTRMHQLLRHLGESSHARDRRCAGAAAGEHPAAPAGHPESSLAAFTVPGVAEAISQAIDADLSPAARQRSRPSIARETASPSWDTADYLLPTIVHCDSPEAAIAKKEYMFPFATVVECPEEKMLESIGPTLVCSAITCRPEFRRKLVDAVAHRSPEPWTRCRRYSSTGFSRTKGTSSSSCSARAHSSPLPFSEQ